MVRDLYYYSYYFVGRDGHISSVREQRNVICTLLELPLLKAKVCCSQLFVL